MLMYRCLFAASLLLSSAFVNAQEKKDVEKPKNAEPFDSTKVEVLFAKDQVPDDLKPGVKVDLRRVDSQTTTATGRVSIRSSVIVPGLEVVSVTKVDKPKAPDEAIKVELKGSKDQIEKVNKYKDQKVKVVERAPGGVPESKEKRIPLRLEKVPAETKKTDEGKKGDSKKAKDGAGDKAKDKEKGL